jgi:hypothetical protein
MPCTTCGQPFTGRACPTCGIAAGPPGLWPGAHTRAVRGVGYAAATAVGVVVALNSAVGLFPVVGRAMAVGARETFDVDALNRAVVIEGILAMAALTGLLVAGVVVIVWLHRACKNLDAFPGATAGLRAGWAIGGWFVPLANLIIPCRVMANLARNSLGRGVGALVGLWWAGWLVSGILGQVVGRRDAAAYEALPGELFDPADFDPYVAYYEGALVRNLLEVATFAAAGLALIVLIVRISRAQEERIARGEAPTDPPHPAAGYPVVALTSVPWTRAPSDRPAWGAASGLVWPAGSVPGAPWPTGSVHGPAMPVPVPGAGVHVPVSGAGVPGRGVGGAGERDATIGR